MDGYRDESLKACEESVETHREKNSFKKQKDDEGTEFENCESDGQKIKGKVSKTDNDRQSEECIEDKEKIYGSQEKNCDTASSL